MSGVRRRWVPALVFVLALALAVGAVAWQGALRYAVADPAPGPLRPAAEPVTAAGFSVLLTRTQRAASFPAEDKGDPPVAAPAGSEFVLVSFTSTLTGTGATKDEALCDFALVGPDGTRWTVESDLSFAIRRPDALSCSGTSEAEIAPDRPVHGAVSFLVPTSARDLVLEVGLSAYDQTFRRRLP